MLCSRWNSLGSWLLLLPVRNSRATCFGFETLDLGGGCTEGRAASKTSLSATLWREEMVVLLWGFFFYCWCFFNWTAGHAFRLMVQAVKTLGDGSIRREVSHLPKWLWGMSMQGQDLRGEVQDVLAETAALPLQPHGVDLGWVEDSQGAFLKLKNDWQGNLLWGRNSWKNKGESAESARHHLSFKNEKVWLI